EDFTYVGDDWVEIIRLPYQRFSDHLIARHLLALHLDTRSITAVRRSFYRNRPLGRIFDPEPGARVFHSPGVASAIMLEFPERVKRALPENERELIFALPKRSRSMRLAPAFIEGLLWRDAKSFDEQTFVLISAMLRGCSGNAQRMLEALVCLAS